MNRGGIPVNPVNAYSVHRERLACTKALDDQYQAGNAYKVPKKPNQN